MVIWQTEDEKEHPQEVKEKNEGRRTTIILDNFRSHTSRRVKKAVEKLVLCSFFYTTLFS
jgi:hypothetical protein